MILGTVQLGLEYGIHNTTGKPDRESAFQILDYAWRHGIKTLDTAGAYGDSERIIGCYQKEYHHTFRVCTKSVSGTAEELAYELEKSLENLGCEQIWLYYLHRYDSCKNRDILRELEKAKEQKKLMHLGISVYEPEELEYILGTLSDLIDVVQIPFNLLDHVRWQENDLLQRAKEKGILIYARSVFLQGLFLQESSSDICRKLMVSETLEELHRMAEACSVSMQQFAISFVLGQPYIDEILLGCETVEQLAQNVTFHKHGKRKKLPEEIIRRLADLSAGTDETVVDPRKWDVR